MHVEMSHIQWIRRTKIDDAFRKNQTESITKHLKSSFFHFAI